MATITPGLLSRDLTKSSLFSGNTGKGKITWQDPDLSVGRFIAKVGKENCWEAVGPAREAFRILALHIKNCLDISFEPITTWVTWHIYMLGTSPQKATPTVLFCCEVAVHRKDVRNAVKDSGILSMYPGFKTGHMARPPEFGRQQQLVQLAGESEASVADNPAKVPVAFAALPNRAPGLQIFVAQGYVGEDRWARRATIGGVVCIRNKFYYTTVAHVFHGWDNTGEDGRACASGEHVDEDFEIDGDSDDDDDAASGANIDAGADETREDEDATTFLGSYRHGRDFDLEGSLQGYARGLEDCTRDTPRQMDLDLLEIGFKSGRLRYLGELAFSSIEDPECDLDYGLIEIMDPLHWAPNEIQTPKNKDYPHWIKPIQLVVSGPADADILCVTSRGTIAGRLSGTPLYGRTPGGRGFQEMLSINLETPLEYGDCGSWVVAADTGDLYGHITAGSHGSRTAFIIPFIDIFENLQRKYGIDAWLPTKVNNELRVSRGPAAIPGNLRVRMTDREFSQHYSGNNVDWSSGLTAKFSELWRSKRLARLKAEWNAVAGESEVKLTQPPPYRLPNRGFPLLPSPPAGFDRDSQRFRNFLLTLSSTPCKYENPGLLDEALRVIPLARVYGEAEEESLLLQTITASISSETKPDWSFQDCVIRALLRWFKRSFFTWVNNPHCPTCFSSTVIQGKTEPTPDERAYGALQVELYKCSDESCGAYERFPRYSDVWRLLQTRQGRRGEWVNCFAMLCRAVGSHVRWVWNAEDTVWIEVYSEHRQRWIHVDPCEEAWDNPRLYNDGMGKKMSYCIAFSNDGAADVTRRYVQRADSALARNKCPEEVLLYILNEIKGIRRASMPKEEVKHLRRQDDLEQRELSLIVANTLTADLISTWVLEKSGNNPNTLEEDNTVVIKEDRDQRLQDSKVSSLASTTPGRKSGSSEWIRASGEQRRAQTRPEDSSMP